MNAVAVNPPGVVANVNPLQTWENSTILKVISSIPPLGCILREITHYTLNKKITAASNGNDVPRMITLIDIKNHYEVAALVHDLLILALSITSITLRILTGAPIRPISIALFVMMIASVAYDCYQIYKNDKIIEDLQNNGYQPGMQVV